MGVWGLGFWGFGSWVLGLGFGIVEQAISESGILVQMRDSEDWGQGGGGGSRGVDYFKVDTLRFMSTDREGYKYPE